MNEFVINIVKSTIEHREKNNVTRKDFMQLLLQLRNSGEVNETEQWNVNTSNFFLSRIITQSVVVVV